MTHLAVAPVCFLLGIFLVTGLSVVGYKQYKAHKAHKMTEAAIQSQKSLTPSTRMVQTWVGKHLMTVYVPR